MSMKTKIKSFFGASRQYAVAGASNNPSKFGFKILSWYVTHDLTVIPINPKEKEILGQPVISSVTEILQAIKDGKDLDIYKLSKVDGLSVSFLTPPHITTSTLKLIASVPGYEELIKGLWFQPGSYDQEVIDTAKEIGLYEKAVYEDECILVRGDEGLLSANL
ncbi:CoA-binding protein [Scheffersomyces xylosifermentans]|uniref:CoA-binding protein n=1 Tax=Scheffersomyces xylosifermentans TaxID=1304137 RepID=UPI00315D1E03